MKDLIPAMLFGLTIGIVIGALIVVLRLTDTYSVNKGVIIGAGCGYYNSDQEFVFKDECKKYYQEVK